MAKQGGMGDALLIAGVDLSGDTGALTRINGGTPNTQDVTGINKSGYERLGLKRDGGFTWSAFFNKATGAAHPTLSTLPRTSVIGTYLRSTTVAKPAASSQFKQMNYDGERSEDGSLLLSVDGQGTDYALEWGLQLTAGPITITGAGSGTGVDFGAAFAFGAQAYLHVLAFTGTDATIRLQGSSDNGAGDAYANVTGGAFATVTTAPYAERIETARGQSMEQWLRYNVATSGGFSSLTFQLMAVINETAVTY